MTEWIKGNPEINTDFWTQISRAEGNGKITTTFISIRGKRGDERLMVKQFVEQINRYTETTIGLDLRALTDKLDDYRNPIRGIHPRSAKEIADREDDVALLAGGTPLEEGGEDKDGSELELPEVPGSSRVRPLF